MLTVRKDSIVEKAMKQHGNNFSLYIVAIL